MDRESLLLVRIENREFIERKQLLIKIMRFIHISISSKELCTSIRLSVCPSRCRNIPLLICIFIYSSIFFRPYVQIDRKSYKTCFCPWFSFLDASLYFYIRVCLSVRPYVCPYVHPSVPPSVRTSVRPYVRPSVCPSVSA